jgi:hypothetical protein
MTQINLIPRERITRSRRKIRVRLWITVLSSYALFLAIAFIASRMTGSGDDQTVQLDLDKTTEVRATTEQLLVTLRADVDQVVSALEANLAVGNQPDWGILLALLQSTRTDEVVLRRCRMIPMRELGDRRDANGAQTITERSRLELSGLGRSPQAVSQFVLAMDQCSLFDRVKLVDTKREPFFDGQATAFRVECVLDAEGDAES